MKVYKQARRSGKELFKVCLVDEHLDHARVRDAVNRVLSAKPRSYMAILGHFQRLLKLELARRTARVETAAPLDPALAASVGANLERIYGQGLDLSFVQNPALIGGLRVKVGSDVYDGSIQARLAALHSPS